MTMPSEQKEAWIETIRDELLSQWEKQVHRPATPEETQEVQTGRLRALPCRLVLAMKRKVTEKNEVTWVRKARLVVCGNFQPLSGEESKPHALSTQQVDPTSVRCCVRDAAYKGKWLATLDIKTAFLNAKLPEGHRIACRPPALCHKLNLVSEELWMLTGALYGLRSAPKLGARAR